MNEYASMIMSSLRERLETAASVASFRSTPIGSFRRQLRSCLVDTILAVSSEQKLSDNGKETTPCWSRHQSEALQEGWKGLPWNELCQFHDQHDVGGGGGGEDATTPLQEVITVLLDPTVVPRSCAGVVVGVLLEALLESPRRAATTTIRNYNYSHGASTSAATTATRWTPSQLVLLRSITTLWNVCPSLNDSFRDWSTSLLLKSSQKNDVHHHHHFSPHKWNRLLSAASHLAGDCPRAHSTILVFLLKILEHVDQMEMDILIGQSETVGERDGANSGARSVASSSHDPTGQCARCSRDKVAASILTSQKRSRGVRLAKLEDLHDKDILSTTDYRPKYLVSQRALPLGGISLKQVLAAKGHTPSATAVKCPSCLCVKRNTTKQRAARQPLLPNEWAVVRCRGYQKFLALFRKQPMMGKLGVLLPPDNKFDFHCLLQAAHAEYQSPCIRLLLLLLACHHKSSTAIHYVCRMTWSRFVSTRDPTWLRIYSEVVTEWSCFDNADACWKAFRPLIDHVMKIVEGMVDDERLLEDKPYHNRQHQGLFQCLAHILSRRSRLFLLCDTKIQEDFQLFVTHLTIHFGEMSWWFDPKEMDVLDGTNAPFCALQRLGILGLTSSLNFHEENESPALDVAKSETDNVETRREYSEVALRDWPFCKPYDLRSAYERVGVDGRTKFEDWDSLLTNPDFDEHLGRLLEDRKQGKIRRASTGPPLTDYIDNPDLLLQVFQYSGYQEIVKCRQVCGAWMTMIDSANSLWHEVYRSRFPLRPSDPRGGLQEASSPQQENWKRLFIQKFIVERSLLHRRHQGTGWKHRTCSYVGCYHVLKSERLEAMHYTYHERQAVAKASRPKRPKQAANKKKRNVGKKVEESSIDKKRAKTRVSSQ